MKKLLFTIIFSTFCGSLVQGQDKYEKEVRIKAQEVPESALAFLGEASIPRKVRWYFEENFVGNSIEAKFKLAGKRYSVEFDTTGHIQDIEIQIPWKEVPNRMKQLVRYSLDSLFTSSKIDKIQLQYTGAQEVLKELLSQDTSTLTHGINYELVVQGKKQKGFQLYEILFSEKGDILRMGQIVEKNTDHLEY